MPWEDTLALIRLVNVACDLHHAPLAQLAEASGSKPGCCQFESDREYQNRTENGTVLPS